MTARELWTVIRGMLCFRFRKKINNQGDRPISRLRDIVAPTLQLDRFNNTERGILLSSGLLPNLHRGNQSRVSPGLNC